MLTFRNSFRAGLHAVLFVGILAVSSRQMTAQDRYAVIPTPGTEITTGQVQSDFTPAGTLPGGPAARPRTARAASLASGMTF